MEVQITIRRGEAGENFLEHAQERAEKLGRYEPRLHRVELLFDEDGGRVAGEARAVVPGVPLLVARADGDTGRAALDRVVRRLGRQLKKERSKRVEHRAPPAAKLAPTILAE